MIDVLYQIHRQYSSNKQMESGETQCYAYSREAGIDWGTDDRVSTSYLRFSEDNYPVCILRERTCERTRTTRVLRLAAAPTRYSLISTSSRSTLSPALLATAIAKSVSKLALYAGSSNSEIFNAVIVALDTTAVWRITCGEIRVG